MTVAELEHRISLLERKLEELTRRHAAPLVTGNQKNEPDVDNGWLQEITGTFKNDAMYRKGIRLGRQWRKAQNSAPSRRKRVARRK